MSSLCVNFNPYFSLFLYAFSLSLSIYLSPLSLSPFSSSFLILSRSFLSLYLSISLLSLCLFPFSLSRFPFPFLSLFLKIKKKSQKKFVRFSLISAKASTGSFHNHAISVKKVGIFALFFSCKLFYFIY